MIGKILTPAASSGGALDYNEDKVMSGDAEVVDVENIDGNDMATIYDTFNEYETNPVIAEQVKKKSFHMTIGPGPTDNLTDEECVELVKEVMEEMGYGGQPYVIYKHHDIERTHYHIVAPRVNKEGKAIASNNEGRRLNAILKQLAGKYGYTVGADMKAYENTELPALTTKEFDPKAANVKLSLKALFEDALQYEFHSLYQFQCIMSAMNVKVSIRRRKDGGNSVVLQGLNDNGSKASRLYSLERNGIRGGEMYERRLAENNEMGVLQMDRKVAIRAISDYVAENTGSAQEYCSALEEAGIRHVVGRDAGSGAIKRVTLVEKNTHTLIDTALNGGLFLKSFTDAEKNRRWAPPSRNPKTWPKPGAKVRKKGAPAFFTPARTGMVKGLIARALEKYRGTGMKPALPGSGGRSLKKGGGK